MGDFARLYYSQVKEITFGAVAANPDRFLPIPTGADRLAFSLAEIRTRFDDLVVMYDLNVMLITRIKFVSDTVSMSRDGEPTYRVAFHSFGIENPKLGLKVNALIDARLYDGPYSPELVSLIMEFYYSRGAAALMKMRQRFPGSAFERLFSSYSFYRSQRLNADVSRAMSAVIHRINRVVRPDIELAGLETIELSIRLDSVIDGGYLRPSIL